ncbi:hypothetical protein N9N28_17675 [Rubripirellula amarantea]|nr:hypothetical protein [Rubripirellula amarantea]
MFGSKHLLIAFVVGVLGVGLLSSVLFSKLEGGSAVLSLVGITLIWVSSLFGSFLAGRETASAVGNKNENGG